jgi:hypothetical protein
MESVYHIVTIRVNETSWSYVWRLRSHYLGMGYDIGYAPLEASGMFLSSLMTILITLGFSSWKVRMKCLSTFGAWL